MITSFVPLFQDKPGIFPKEELYNTNPKYPLTGTNFPVEDTFMLDGNVVYVCRNVNVETLSFDIEPALLSDATDGYGVASVVNTDNEVFRAFYDARAQPYTLNIDGLFKLRGGSPSRYEIVRYYNTPKAVTISQTYDATGKFLSTQGQFQASVGNEQEFYPNSCFLSQLPVDDEALQLIAYNETGAEVATVRLTAKQSNIINDLATYQPKVISLTLKANQLLQSGACYLYQKQSFADLNVRAVLNYQDGSSREIPIDGRECRMYGHEDFVAAYAGLRQSILLKYRLPFDEVSAVTGTQGAGFISCTFTVEVVPNELSVPVKLSVIPSWNATLNQYTLRYFYYTTSGLMMADVTDKIVPVSGAFNPVDFTNEQSFQVSLDLSQVDTTTYKTTTMYVQNVAIRLRPPVALVRWTIRDALSSPYIYGMDSTADRRPVLFYDQTLNQHFISSSLFPSKEAFLQSFFTDSNPPYNPSLSLSPTTPTHFVIRDPYRGVLITPDAVPVENYKEALTLITTGSGSGYVGATLVVEFISRTSAGSDVIIYGAPVDIYQGTYAS